MRRLGIVDIGSNTIRLVVFVRQASGGFRLQDDFRERVRLGTGLARDGRIEEARLERAIDLLRRFADFGRGSGLDDLAVIGTSALRDAANGERLLSAAGAMGLDIEVLSGKREARYGVVAVANGFDLDHAWVMDLGGGSAQVSSMVDRRFARGKAYPLGAVRLTEMHLTDDPPKRGQVRALEQAVEEALGRVAKAMRKSHEPLVVMGGSVRNLARAVQKRNRYPLSLLHGFWLDRPALEALTEELLSTPARKRAKISGIHAERADVILAAALVFRWLLRATDREGLLISGHGVREGALYHHVLRAPHVVPEVGRASIEGLVEQHVADRDQARRVSRRAAEVFDQLQPLHGMGPREKVLLDAAALLHESGMSVHFYRRQQHGAFLLQSVAIDGFTHREQALILLQVRYHRKGTPRLGVWRGLLDDDDRGRLLCLVACLRIACALERTRSGRLGPIAVVQNGDEVELEVSVPARQCVELADLAERLDLVGRAFGRRFVLAPVVTPPKPPDPHARPAYDPTA